MTPINKLGIRVALITGAVLLVFFGGWWVLLWYLNADSSKGAGPVAGSPSELTETDVSQDSDGDGLADLVENIYRSDPQVADTDGDGVPDGEEVRAGRNPAGEDSIEIGPWTEKYLATLPEDATDEQILEPARLEKFVNENKGALLPALPEGTIKTTPQTDQKTVSAYLDQITLSTNPKLHTVSTADITSAWQTLYTTGEAAALQDILKKLHENVDTVEAVVAPANLKDLHTKVVAASHALTNNTELLSNVITDWVGALIGAKNIDELETVFKEIEEELQRLKSG